MMPWGMYGPDKGNRRMMQEVPASYLHHFWTEKGLKNEVATNPVAEYIRRNLDCMKVEYPDGIW